MAAADGYNVCILLGEIKARWKHGRKVHLKT